MTIDRLIGIVAVLLREGQVTAGRLAERFEVSARTIHRDVDRLCRAGIPLRTARGAGGGISIMEGYQLDGTVLTDEDRGAILAGLRSLDSVSGTGYYRQLMEKLPQGAGSAGDDCVLIDLSSWYGPVLPQFPRHHENQITVTSRSFCCHKRLRLRHTHHGMELVEHVSCKHLRLAYNETSRRSRRARS